MDKTFFLRHYGILLSSKSVLIDTDVAELTYQAFQNDFTDEEFATVCLMVLKNENFYGRPPDPAIFSKYVKASTAETDFIEKCARLFAAGLCVHGKTRRFCRKLNAQRRTRSLFFRGHIDIMVDMSSERNIQSGSLRLQIESIKGYFQIDRHSGTKTITRYRHAKGETNQAHHLLCFKANNLKGKKKRISMKKRQDTRFVIRSCSARHAYG